MMSLHDAAEELFLFFCLELVAYEDRLDDGRVATLMFNAC